MAAASYTHRQAAAIQDLSSLVITSLTSTIYPTEDDLLTLVHARARGDFAYTRIGSTSLLVVNPLKNLQNLSDSSAKEYAEVEYQDTSGLSRKGELQPHPYEWAARVYSVMRRRKESQGVVFFGLTGSGKTFTSSLFVSQVLRLSSKTKKDSRIVNQIKSIFTILDSFGSAKTLDNVSASRHSRYLELHFEGESGRISGAQLLTFGLEKRRIIKLSPDERTFHVFYQLLAGASPEEREFLRLDEPSSYTLLASSGCYRLPGGPFSDDSAQMGELRVAMATLGFKPKHVNSIFNILVSILLLGNLEFIDNGLLELSYESAKVKNPPVLDEVCRLLGVPSDLLEQALCNKTKFLGRDVASVFLMKEGAEAQRNSFVRDLYSILFTFVVELTNRKLAPNEGDQIPMTQIVLFDQAGFQSKLTSGTIASSAQAPLISAYGQNQFYELTVNFSNEMIHSYYTQYVFSDDLGYNLEMATDRVNLPQVLINDNLGCLELLRGGALGSRADERLTGLLGVVDKSTAKMKRGKAQENPDGELLDDLSLKFGVHSSFITSPSVGLGPTTEKNLFGIVHYNGSCTYDVTGLVEANDDTLDASFITLLRNSSDPFVAKLFSGTGITTQLHPQDNETVVLAQVPTTSLRRPTPILPPSHDDAESTIPPVIPPAEPLFDSSTIYPVATQLNASLVDVISSLNQTRLWNVLCIRPNDSGLPGSLDKRRIKSQIRQLLLPQLIARKRPDIVAHLDIRPFMARYRISRSEHPHGSIHQWADKKSWVENQQYVVGESKVWLNYDAWKEVEDELRAEEISHGAGGEDGEEAESFAPDEHPLKQSTKQLSPSGTPWRGTFSETESTEDLLIKRSTTGDSGYFASAAGAAGGFAAYEGVESSRLSNFIPASRSGYAESWNGPENWNSDVKAPLSPDLGGHEMTVKEKTGQVVEHIPINGPRRWWIRFCWCITWMAPSFLLNHWGKMRRPDVRLAWREKVTICFLILFLCLIVLFYVIIFGRILCPQFDYAWNEEELGEHGTSNDFYVAVAGKVYDITNFWQGQHSDASSYPVTDTVMLEMAGQDLTDYFPVPFTVSCPGLVTDESLQLQRNFSPVADYAVHWSGTLQTYGSSVLSNVDWYPNTFLPFMKDYYKGVYVYDTKTIRAQAEDGSKTWAIINNGIYDLSDYFTTVTYHESDATGSLNYSFLDKSLTSLFQNTPGQDISKTFAKAISAMNETYAAEQFNCLSNAFYVGQTDFRKSPRCTVNNYILLAFSCIIMATIGAKFLAALQLGGKRNPEVMNKFVICQIPCYTEGEESLRRTIDSLASLRYDDKRKLLFIICDGNIIGSGNDKTTPRIVLDILGVDPKLDPEPLLFKSVGEGLGQLNYGKIYSGLYEFEGHVVPYMVVVKVGRPSERSKPGNRGKRDSQVLLLKYLNRVHFDAPMCPLELEIYHQMRNIIGIDPAFYEYLFQVDADTSVHPDSLNRLIACAANDQRIIGICGETKLQNEYQSVTTMMQVYEYYISHHLSKAFESLFGSVTCLPGCFSVYRLRTADKGRPVIISQRIIEDYSEPMVDTLHKKNLFSLGEDRYLTTLMMKYFPSYKMKFTPDALAYTVAPDSWKVLLSQRRRWINSTIHNLAELYFLPEMCGFCLFGMRFIVMLDLIGTIILPATCVYLIYLIVVVAIGSSPIPVIALAMIGATYGLQMIIFIIKREFAMIGWMFIYILSFPIYSFFLPIYSFWSMDDFSWGNTRVVIGEGKDKTVVTTEAEQFDDSMIPMKKFSDYEADAWDSGSRSKSPTNSEQASAKGSNTGSSYKPYSDNKYARGRSQSPAAFSQSNGGDYYRDTNVLHAAASRSNLKGLAGSRMPSMASLDGSQSGQAPPYSMPHHLPSSQASEYSLALYQPYGIPTAPRGTMMSMNMASPSMYSLAVPPSMNFGHLQDPRMSSYSLSTNNPFASAQPNPATDPTDEEIMRELKSYLATQDLMTVTKKSTRQTIASRFPNADLSGKTKWINQSIDKILSGEA